LNLSGDFGKVVAGRIASVASDSGSMGLFGALDPFGTSYNYAAMTAKTGSAMTRYDNVLGYVSPKFAGVEVRAQYSMGGANENKAVDNARYGVVAANYTAGALTLVASAEHYDYANTAASNEDGMSFLVGGNFKTDFATFYGFVNYFQDIVGAKETFGLGGSKVAVDGYGVSLAATTPVCGGKFMASVGYRDMEASDDSSAEGNRLSGSVGFEYALSKRTTAYVVGTYVQEEWKNADMDGYQIGTGIVHKF
jgi:predicted porin